MEDLKAPQFRAELATNIRKVPKGDRKAILERAKETSAYWQARSDKLKPNQPEESINDGHGIFIKKKVLYHGSGTSGIQQLTKAEEDTVGNGVYFTSEPTSAVGYARRRARSREGNPVIYEASVENIRLLDLRNSENVKELLKDFKPLLVEQLKAPNLKWNWAEVLRRTIKLINSGTVGSGNLRDITFSNGLTFSGYVKSLGYDGLVTFEGGEGEDIGSHDTYLIFEPEKAKITREHKVL